MTFRMAALVGLMVGLVGAAEPELPRGLPARPLDGSLLREIQLLWEWDTNGDGTLSREERAAAFRRGGPKSANQPPATGPASEPKKSESPAAGRSLFPNLPEAVVRRFDKNQDGRLDREELAAARTAAERFRGPGGGSGLLPGEGQPIAPKLDVQSLVKRFDRDGNGRLNEEERAAARAALRDLTNPER